MKRKFEIHIQLQGISAFAKSMEETRIRIEELNKVLQTTRKFRAKPISRFERKIQKKRKLLKSIRRRI